MNFKMCQHFVGNITALLLLQIIEAAIKAREIQLCRWDATATVTLKAAHFYLRWVTYLGLKLLDDPLWFGAEISITKHFPNNWWTQVNISAWHILGTQQDLTSQQRNHKYNGKRISSMILGNEAGLLTISSLLDMANKSLQGDWNTQTAARANTNRCFICQ